MAAIAAATRQPTGIRFPCGHVVGARAVTRRVRSTPRAVWIACRRCNVIALAIGATTKSERRA